MIPVQGLFANPKLSARVRQSKYLMQPQVTTRACDGFGTTFIGFIFIQEAFLHKPVETGFRGPFHKGKALQQQDELFQTT
jgi:hypothetical protein